MIDVEGRGERHRRPRRMIPPIVRAAYIRIYAYGRMRECLSPCAAPGCVPRAHARVCTRTQVPCSLVEQAVLPGWPLPHDPKPRAHIPAPPALHVSIVHLVVRPRDSRASGSRGQQQQQQDAGSGGSSTGRRRSGEGRAPEHAGRGYEGQEDPARDDDTPGEAAAAPAPPTPAFLTFSPRPVEPPYPVRALGELPRIAQPFSISAVRARPATAAVDGPGGLPIE